MLPIVERGIDAKLDRELFVFNKKIAYVFVFTVLSLRFFPLYTEKMCLLFDDNFLYIYFNNLIYHNSPLACRFFVSNFFLYFYLLFFISRIYYVFWFKKIAYRKKIKLSNIFSCSILFFCVIIFFYPVYIVSWTPEAIKFSSYTRLLNTDMISVWATGFVYLLGELMIQIGGLIFLTWQRDKDSGFVRLGD